jgi:hypothetical protein
LGQPAGFLAISAELLYPEPISPLIYGDFVEFINDNLPAMRAERVEDRCFEGPRQPRYVYPPGQNWVYPRWQPLIVGRPQFTSVDAVRVELPRATVKYVLDVAPTEEIRPRPEGAIALSFPPFSVTCLHIGQGRTTPEGWLAEYDSLPRRQRDARSRSVAHSSGSENQAGRTVPLRIPGDGRL